MSIIYEALRKTQRNREVRSLPTRERVAARNLDWLDKVLVVFIILLLLIIMVLYIPHLFKHHPVQQVAIVATPVLAVNTVAEVKPVLEAASSSATPQVQNNLILNGVLLSDNEKIALINKKTFHVGDNVEGMKIVKIEFDNVQLNNDGKLVTLRTSS